MEIDLAVVDNRRFAGGCLLIDATEELDDSTVNEGRPASSRVFVEEHTICVVSHQVASGRAFLLEAKGPIESLHDTGFVDYPSRVEGEISIEIKLTGTGIEGDGINRRSCGRDGRHGR